jgi:hypothetical protein
MRRGASEEFRVKSEELKKAARPVAHGVAS